MKRKVMGAGVATAAAFAAAGIFIAPAIGQTPAFGGPDDDSYAQALWSALQAADLVGDNAIHSNLYPGQEPHGAVLETMDTTLTVNGETAPVIIKNNYGPAGVDPATVLREAMRIWRFLFCARKRCSGPSPVTRPSQASVLVSAVPWSRRVIFAPHRADSAGIARAVSKGPGCWNASRAARAPSMRHSSIGARVSMPRASGCGRNSPWSVSASAPS